MPLYGEDLAHVHHAGFTGLVREAAPGLLKELRRAGKTDAPGGLVVDLGCGSGVWARALTGAGYAVLGLDRSRAMIALARKTAPAARFRATSLHRATIPECHAVTAIGEVLNYVDGAGLTRRQAGSRLRALLEKIHSRLRPGGLLVFDVREPDPPRPPSVCFSGRGWNVMVENRQQDDQLERRITTFRKMGDLYRRSRETHHLRLHPAAEVSALLQRCGFSPDETDHLGAVRLERGHRVFIATRR